MLHDTLNKANSLEDKTKNLQGLLETDNDFAFLNLVMRQEFFKEKMTDFIAALRKDIQDLKDRLTKEFDDL